MKLHKLSLVAALALGGLLACTSVSSAQDAKKGERRGFSPQQRVERMTQDLKLTDDQKTKVTALFEADAKKRQDIMADTSLSREQRREKMQPIMEEENKKLKTILTPEQYDKWQKMREEMRTKAKKTE
ncbi:MAG TPA: hypothetical protein VNT26_12450 [Candidatus Sulfotelmatobacter sp.]|nr:hypothetical protein [Candidatus Sulfotelmatobacter sp.]